jgi:hypothetical protein
VPRCECHRHLPSSRTYPGRRLPLDTVSLTAVLAPVVLVGAAVVAVALSTLLSAPPEDRFGQPTSLPESPPPEPPTRSEATETTPAEGRSYLRTSRVQPTCWRTRLLEAAVHDGAMVAPPAALLAVVFQQQRLYALTSSGGDLLRLTRWFFQRSGPFGSEIPWIWQSVRPALVRHNIQAHRREVVSRAEMEGPSRFMHLLEAQDSREPQTVGCAARGVAEPPPQAEPEDLPHLLLALARGDHDDLVLAAALAYWGATARRGSRTLRLVR